MTEPHYADDAVTLYHGDCLDVLKELPDASIDAVVTDPPYGLEFMGKDWDKFGDVVDDPASVGGFQDGAGGNPYSRSRIRYGVNGNGFQAWCEQWAAECLRVLKPGGFMLAFGGTRTWHRLACAIEDAGFEIRDSVAWIYAQGFPKSLDVSKAIDRAAGAQREKIGTGKSGPATVAFAREAPGEYDVTAPATADAQTWAGWGTALKPAHEPIVVARKPLAGTVAANVLTYGTGALNVDGCRIGGEGGTRAVNFVKKDDGRLARWDEGHRGARNEIENLNAGRWPANVVLDPAAAEELDRQSGPAGSNSGKPQNADGTLSTTGDVFPRPNRAPHDGREWDTRDAGGASRFFYVAKAGSNERPREGTTAHPTVKPLDLMRWLVRLVTPPGGVVLEPFAGSGSTAEACVIEGFQCIAIEREADYLPLIVQRLSKPIEPVMF